MPDSQKTTRPPTPRWVQAVGLLVLIVLLAFVGIHVLGGGLGGRHMHDMSAPGGTK
jgi:hypothetical protein